MPRLSIDQCWFCFANAIDSGSVNKLQFKFAHDVLVLLVLIASRTSECPDESLHMTIL